MGQIRKLRRSKKDVDDYGTNYEGDLSPDDRLNESMKHGDAADSSSESEESEQDCNVRRRSNLIIMSFIQIDKKESSQSKENSHDISQDNSDN